MKRAKRMRRPRRRPTWLLRRPLLPHQAQALAQAASVYSAALFDRAMRSPLLPRLLTDFDAVHLTPIPPWFGMEFSEVYDPTNFEAKPSA